MIAKTMPPPPLPLVWQKRCFDIAISFAILVILSPVMLLFIVLIFLEHLFLRHPLDPIFYYDARISRNKIFQLCKFNIFDQRVVDALRQQHVFIHTKELEWSGKTTIVGKVLRQVYLDELPQIWNVMKGEMSLVGPRPLNKEVYENVNTTGVHPLAYIQGGMTGYFQSEKDFAQSNATTMDSIYLSKYFNESGWNLLIFDTKIILRTVQVLLRAKGV